MSFLLDSHALLWWANGARFDRRARARIERARTVVSSVSVWELSYKHTIGKLRLVRSITDEVERAAFEKLEVTFEHAERAGRLPLHHRDPFDRMLVAQAQVERLTLVTRDPVFDAYDVDVLRC